jgi:hypothetical protein
MIGLAGLPREPSLVWQAAQTAVEIAAPLAGSGALAAGSAAKAPTPVRAAASVQSNRGTGFMGREFLVPKQAILQ